MDGVKTNTATFVTDEQNRCIAMVAAIPEENINCIIPFARIQFRIYVAWEWETMAKRKYFGFIKSRELYKNITEKAISQTADYGTEISEEEARKLFPTLFTITNQSKKPTK